MPRVIYKNKGGVRLPSVTGVIKHVDADPGGLMHWAWQLGMEGISMDEARDEAAGVGKVVHACIEAELKGETVSIATVPVAMRAQVEEALGVWATWKAQAGFDAVACAACGGAYETVPSHECCAARAPAVELQGVSESFQVGGTLDAVLIQRGKRLLFDFKTGNALYTKDLVQVAAYGLIWDELHPVASIDQYSLLRIAKDGCGFTWKHLDGLSMDPARGAFRHAREIYDYARVLAMMVK